HLEGFAPTVDGLTIEAGTESRLDEQLMVAPVAETVIVYGRAPADPPAPPPPPPVVIPVPVHDRESICGPAKPGAGARAESFGTIRSHRYETDRELYTKDDQLTLNGGTLNGLEVGQNLVVRRHYRVSGGARVGQRLTLFRWPRRSGATPAVVGEAVVVAIRADSATIRVERATDAIAFGEWAAPQRQSSGDSPASARANSRVIW